MDLALDLGSGNTRVADASGAVLLDEPTVAAVDADSGRLLAFGREALALVAASAGRVTGVRPVRRGQLVDLELADALIAEVLRRAGAGRMTRPRVLAAVSAAATPVQTRALARSLRHAGARAVEFAEVSVCCALGAGLPIDEPAGWMVVSIGAGTTEAGVLALGGIVASTAAPVGGEDLHRAVHQHLAERHGVHVERRVIDELMRLLGAVSGAAGPGAGSPEEPQPVAELVGRDRRSGVPRRVQVGRDELSAALEPDVRRMLEAVVSTITKAPPDLANDLLGSGVQLAGGVARLEGLDRRLARATGLPVHVDEPELLAVRGAAGRLAERVSSEQSLSAVPRH